MKRIIYIAALVLGLLLSQTAFCQGKLEFKTLIWDFGTINEDGGPVMKAFGFRNHGTGTSVIERVTASCSCMKVYLGESSFDKGESGEMTASFDPSGLSGDQYKTVTIFTNTPGEKVVLGIRGKVVNKKVDESYSVNLGGGLRARTMDLDFGNIYSGEKFIRSLQLWNTSGKTVGVVVTGASSRLKVYGEGKLPAGEKGDLDLVYDIPASDTNYGSLTETLHLVIDGSVCMKPLKISSRCIEKTSRNAPTKPRMELSCKELSLKNPIFGNKASGHFDIKNSGNATLKIRKIELSGPVGCSLKSGSSIPMGNTVRVDASLSGEEGLIRIFTNDPVRPFIEIPVHSR